MCISSRLCLFTFLIFSFDIPALQACCSEISSRQSQFERLRSLAEQCLIRSNDKISDAIEREFHEVQTRWLRVSDSIASNQRTLELTLEDWQEYTTVMEDIMKWLRRTELYLKTASASSLSDLEKYYERLKVLGFSYCCHFNGCLKAYIPALSSFLSCSTLFIFKFVNMFYCYYNSLHPLMDR